MIYLLNYTVNLQGGTAPFSYLWNSPCEAVVFPGSRTRQSVTISINSNFVPSGICNLTCTVTDAEGCTIVLQYLIEYPGAPELLGTSYRVTCKDQPVINIPIESLVKNSGTLDRSTIEIATSGGFEGSYVIDSLNGIIKYTTVYPLPVSPKVDTMFVTVKDTAGNRSNQVAITVSLNPCINGPATLPDTLITPFNTPGIIDVGANDTNVIRIYIQTMPQYGTITVSGTVITYTPGLNYEGADELTYIAYDHNGVASDPVTVDITVQTGTPVAVPVTEILSLLWVNGFLQITGTISNVNSMDDITVRRNGVIVDDSAFSYNPVTDVFSGIFLSGSSGVQQVVVTAINEAGSSQDIASVTVPVNQAPLAVDELITGNYNASTVMNLISNDSDPEGDTITIIELNEVAKAIGDTLALTNGTLELTSAGVVTFTPNLDWEGTLVFTYTISDGKGNQDIGKVTLTVANPCPGLMADVGYNTIDSTTVELFIQMDNLTSPIYQWYRFAGSWQVIVGAITATYIYSDPTPAGSYKIIVTDIGCTYEETFNIPA